MARSTSSTTCSAGLGWRLSQSQQTLPPQQHLVADLLRRTFFGIGGAAAWFGFDWNQVIEDIDIKQFSCLNDLPGDRDILRTGCWIAGRVVVDDHFARAGAAEQRGHGVGDARFGEPSDVLGSHDPHATGGARSRCDAARGGRPRDRSAPVAIVHGRRRGTTASVGR